MNEIASRYALALFSIAKDDNKVLEMQLEMKELEKVFKENQDFLMVLSSNFKSIEERCELIDKTFIGVDKDIISLFKLIIEHSRVSLIMDLFIDFNSFCNKDRGIDEGIIYSVSPLSESVISEIEKKISKKENSTLELRNVIDPSLIGGVKIQIHDHIYDGSIKNTLENMRKDLLKKEGK